MSQNALGTWRKPPLAYVVAELVISPYYNLAEKIPALQDALRTDFPRTVEGKQVVITDASQPPKVHPLWHLISADQRLGVQVATQSISLHATTYVDSDDFLARWRNVLGAVQASGLSPFVERAGLRYVDLIVPSDGKATSAYLVPQLQGITPEGAKTSGCMWAAAFQYDTAVVNLRAAAPAPTGVVLPPDFNALPLQKPLVMTEAEGLLKIDKSIGFIDTDCIRDIGQVLEPSLIVGIYDGMQKLASKTFNAALSEIAKKEWQ